MSHSSEASSTEHSRERMVTLPPIRVIFREQLASSSPQSSPHLSHPSYNSSPAGPRFTSESRNAPALSRTPSASPQINCGRGESSWRCSTSRRTVAPALRSPPSYGSVSSETSHRRPVPEHGRSHGSSPALAAGQSLPPSGYHYTPGNEPSRHMSSTSVPSRTGNSSRSSAPSDAAWTEHRRRDSMDSVWSSHSGSSAASSHTRSIPAPSNALQFQPLPYTHSQMVSSNPRAATSVSTHNPTPTDYQSPFGVLIADIDPRSSSSSDRTAIMRTLRASGVQGSFQLNFDDQAHVQNPPRYSCQYCGKGFARPSSLRIHINSHTGEKPFQCPHPGCGRRFSVHSNMRRHYRVHSGVAPKNGEGSGDEGTDG